MNHRLASCSLSEEIVLLDLHLAGNSFQSLVRNLPLEDSLCKLGVLFLQHLELPLDLVSGFVHLRSDHGKVAAVLPKEFDKGVDVWSGPVGNVLLFELVDGFVFVFEFVLEGDFVDESGESGNWLCAGILMAVELINSHAEDTTGRAWGWKSCKICVVGWK